MTRLLYVVLVSSSIQGALSQTWTVNSGSCTTTGVCVRSPNFGTGYYTSSESCSITLNTAGYISDTYFYSEAVLDKLNIRRRAPYEENYGRRRTARREITDVYLDAAETLTWSTDSSLNYKGWQLCHSSTTQNSRRRYTSSLTYPTVYTEFPDAYAGCCKSDSACWAYTGTCSAGDRDSSCWEGDFCYANDSSDCCNNTGAIIVGILIGLGVAAACIAGAVVMCCYFCHCCPWYKKRTGTAVVVQSSQCQAVQQPQIVQPPMPIQPAQPPPPYQQQPILAQPIQPIPMQPIPAQPIQPIPMQPFPAQHVQPGGFCSNCGHPCAPGQFCASCGTKN